ncbi:hypothetical protein B0H16DRAFT_1894696, partial [Mycena metata]
CLPCAPDVFPPPRPQCIPPHPQRPPSSTSSRATNVFPAPPNVFPPPAPNVSPPDDFLPRAPNVVPPAPPTSPSPTFSPCPQRLPSPAPPTFPLPDAFLPRAPNVFPVPRPQRLQRRTSNTSSSPHSFSRPRSTPPPLACSHSPRTDSFPLTGSLLAEPSDLETNVRRWLGAGVIFVLCRKRSGSG